MECVGPGAVLVNPRGDVAIGKEAIRRALDSFLRGEASRSSHESELERVSFIGDDVAVVDGRAKIEGGSLDSVIEHRFTDILVRERGRWFIVHVRAYMFDAG